MRYGRKRVVFDTNNLVSAALFGNSPSAEVYRRAVLQCDLYRSVDTFAELVHVLGRDKFDRYFAPGKSTRTDFLLAYEQASTLAEVRIIAMDCADPKDNKFLSLALSVEADVLVSGDQKHLLPMHPYKGVAILSAADFLLTLT
jgi:uncharacterized protein